MTRAGAVAFVVLLASVYVFAVGTGEGRRLDDDAIDYYLYKHDRDRARAQIVAYSSGIPIIAPLTLALVALALWRRGRRAALVVAALVAGAAGSARVLKVVLEAVDPFDAEQLRHFGPGYFPSGHAAAVMAVVLALVLITRAGAARAAVALVGGAVAALISVAHIIGLTHHPTDLVGGSLLAGAWALGLSGLLAEAGPGQRRRPRLRDGLPALLAAVVVAAAWALVAARRELEPRPAIATAAVVVSALAVAGIAAALAPGSAPAGGRPVNHLR